MALDYPDLEIGVVYIQSKQSNEPATVHYLDLNKFASECQKWKIDYRY